MLNIHAKPVEVEGYNPPKNQTIYDLPPALRQKHWPVKILAGELAERHAKLTASVMPAKYRSLDAAREAKRLEGVSCPPNTNRGGKVDRRLPSYQAKEKLQIYSLGKAGKYQMVRIPLKDTGKSIRHSFIDWVNFTFKTASLPLSLSTGHQALSNFDYVQALSAQLFDIFGLGVTGQRPNGLNFYAESYDIGDRGEGVICIGGQRDSVLVTMKGQGLMASVPGWEARLMAFLKMIPGAQLTRVDLASDNFNSKVSLENYLDMYRADLFTSAGRPPNVECLGNWERPNGKGRTLYIGSRTSGKLLRIYEKGLQLANGFHEKYPNWVRVELELKNIDRVIPLDVLLAPGQYLAGAYPALANLYKIQNRIQTQKKTIKSTVERAIETTAHQFGKYIWTFKELFGIEETIKRLTDKKQELPKKLIFDTFEQYQPSDFIHNLQVFTTKEIII